MDSRNAENVMTGMVEEGGKIVAVGTIVATGLLPLDWMMHRVHTQASSNQSSVKSTKSSTARLSVLFTMGKQIAESAVNTIFTTYPHSVKAATVKNSVIGQRTNVEEMVTGKSDGVEEKVEQNSLALTLSQSATVAGIVGVADTLLTQYHSNLRVLGFEAAKPNTSFVMPTIHSMHDRKKIYVAGLPSRMAKNSMVVSGFVINPYVAEQIKALLPHSDYIDIPRWIATIIGGSTTGLIGNVFDIVYKNQIIRMNPVTLTTPSAYSVINDLMMKESVYKALLRGWRPAIMYTVAAQAIVPKAEEIAEKIIPVLFNQLNTLFQPNRSLPNKNEKEEDIRLCPVRHC